ncbi:MAG: hypothetical protein MUF48_04025 [Pirellulaceae bacterium]|jgi:DNA/RNA-binding domain of Phe-tRNA-synthetase-like protein|nr:hypothetical protein [Pirellulaceae bacterium]
MTWPFSIDAAVAELAVGLVEAVGLTIAPPTAALTAECHAHVARVCQTGPEGGDGRRQAVRDLLRAGGFKPSGRNKPAQEYLARAAAEPGQWPSILNAVDVLNVVSLRSGLPISLVALERAGPALVVRYGTAGERFVFNASGQELDVEGLLCLCRADGPRSVPIGSPVKDSQEAKVRLGDRHVLACIFAPRAAVTPPVLTHWSAELADGLRRWCAPHEVLVRLEPRTWS